MFQHRITPSSEKSERRDSRRCRLQRNLLGDGVARAAGLSVDFPYITQGFSRPRRDHRSDAVTTPAQRPGQGRPGRQFPASGRSSSAGWLRPPRRVVTSTVQACARRDDVEQLVGLEPSSETERHRNWRRRPAAGLACSTPERCIVDAVIGLDRSERQPSRGCPLPRSADLPSDAPAVNRRLEGLYE